MARDWEAAFSRWAQSPSASETARMENAERAVRDAIGQYDRLSSICRVFRQGSYRNRVNVREESDVDIGVLYTGNEFYPAYPDGMSGSDFDVVEGRYSYREFKDAVGDALLGFFGSSNVRRGSKAFDVKANSYRVDADVTPFFVHRRYRTNGSYLCGVQMISDTGERIVNWPERLYDEPSWPAQHYENAVSLNTDTSRRFKAAVRILKSLRGELDAAGVPSAKAMKGFLIECLVSNLPPSWFDGATWDEIVQQCMGFLWKGSGTAEGCANWTEVSKLKYLFTGSPDAKRLVAHQFLDALWNYIGVR